MQEVNNRIGGTGDVKEFSDLSAHFFCKPMTTLKKWTLFKWQWNGKDKLEKYFARNWQWMINILNKQGSNKSMTKIIKVPNILRT